MSFLTPWFWLGLAGLAAPIVIHLFHRQQKEPIRFPSLMFLERIPFRTVRRQTLRDPLLFAVRALLVLLLVAAFARPFLGGRDLEAGEAGAREVVVLLDRSYSMGYGDRFDDALDRVRSVAGSLQPSDAVSLVVFDTEAEMPVRSGPALELTQALDTLATGWAATRLPPALEAAASILQASPRPRREVVIVSDFQRAAWTDSDDVLFPAGTMVRTESVAQSASPNVLLAGASARRVDDGGRVRVQVSARLVNAGNAPQSGTSVTLRVDGSEAEVQTVDLGASGEADGQAAVAFQPFVLARPDTRIEVHLDGDALAADDRLHMVLSPEPDRSVLLLRPPGQRRDQSLFVERALSVGDEGAFRVDVQRSDRVTAAEMVRPSAVILNGAAPPDGATFDRLLEWVRAGGGLLVALDERSAWPSDQADVLGGTFGAPRNRSGAAERGGALGFVDYDHPAFEIFQGPRSGDLTAVRFFRYRPFEPDSTTHVLARFDDGAVALAERSLGEGRILVWTAGLDNFWSDFPVHPVYVPFTQSVVDYLSGREEQPDQYTVGNLVDVTPFADDLEESLLVALAPSGGDEVVPQDSTGARLLRLREPGFYEVRADDPGAPARPVAVNVDPAESDLEFVDTEQVVAALTPGADAASGGGPGNDSGLSVEVVERSQSVWRYLIMAVLVLALLETWLANRGSTITRRKERPVAAQKG